MRGDWFKVAMCAASTAIWIATCGRPDVADVKKLQRVPSPLVIWVINRLVILLNLCMLNVNFMIEYRMHGASVVNNINAKFSTKLGRDVMFSIESKIYKSYACVMRTRRRRMVPWPDLLTAIRTLLSVNSI